MWDLLFSQYYWTSENECQCVLSSHDKLDDGQVNDTLAIISYLYGTIFTEYSRSHQSLR